MTLCESIDTLAMAYLDDELATEERHELETHLTACASCKAELDLARGSHNFLRTSLQAPRATDTMRMRIARALDGAERDELRTQRRRMSAWVLPGSAILAAAAAIAVFVGTSVKTGEQQAPVARAKLGGSVVKSALRQQTREVPPEIEGPGTDERLSKLAGMAAPRLPSSASRVIGGRFLPMGVNGHDATLISYDITLKGEHVQLSMLQIQDIGAEEMTDGDEVESGGRALRVLHSDGHTAVTYVDARNRLGYMFMAEALPEGELVSLVGRTSLVVGPQE
jgi:anti-sigma factor RsiW